MNIKYIREILLTVTIMLCFSVAVVSAGGFDGTNFPLEPHQENGVAAFIRDDALTNYDTDSLNNFSQDDTSKVVGGEGLVSRFLWSLLGGLIGAVIALWLEKFQKPHLGVSVGNLADSEHTYPVGYVVPGRWKFVRLRVTNRKLSPWLSWFMSREAAESLHAQIEFVDLNRTMKGRWSSTLELAYASNFDKIKLAQYPEPETIFVGESVNLDVIAKYEHDAEAYGWNNEAYLNLWRTPHYKLDPGEYRIEVKLRGTNCDKKVLLKLHVDALIEKTQLYEVSKW